MRTKEEDWKETYVFKVFTAIEENLFLAGFVYIKITFWWQKERKVSYNLAA